MPEPDSGSRIGMTCGPHPSVGEREKEMDWRAGLGPRKRKGEGRKVGLGKKKKKERRERWPVGQEGEKK